MITSNSNQQIKYVLQLQKKSKLRNETHTFVAEGIKMYSEIPANMIVKTYISESFCNEKFEKLKKKPEEYEIVADNVFDEMAQTMTPQGIIAIVKQPEYNFEEIINRDKVTLLMLEDIRDPGNLGTIMRTAEGAGIDGIVLSKESVDMFNPKVVRSTMGAIFRMPFIYEDDFTDKLKCRYISKGFKIYAAHLEGAVDYAFVNYPQKCAIIIGNEANGITNETAKLANQMIKIPMQGNVESLNAAVSAAVIMYEIFRQRRF